MRSRAEFQKYELAFVKHNEEKKHLKSQLKKTQASIEKDTKKESEVRAEIDKMRQDVPRHEAKEREVTESIQKTEAEMTAMYESIKVETEPVRIKIEAKQREREPKAQSLDKIKAEAELNASEARLLAEKQQHVLDHVSQFDIANPRALSLIISWDLSLRATAEIHNQTAHRSE